MNVIRRLQSLRRQEHESTVAIVESLVECYRSRAYVDFGYSTIWSFLVEELKYSNAAASRRYKAMKCAMKFPVVLEMLREHRVSLTSLAKVEALLQSIEDPKALLDAIDGRSQAEVERVVAQARPVKMVPKARVRRVFAGSASLASDDMFGSASALEADRSSAAQVAGLNTGVKTSGAEVAPPPTELIAVTLHLTPEDYQALERARAIVAKKQGGRPTLEAGFHELALSYEAKKTSKRRVKSKPEASKAKAALKPAPRPNATPNARPTPTSRTRHIRAAIRNLVLARDDNRCTFTGPTGHRCNATHDIELDHIHPFALGGAHEPENLRVLCANHNRRRAEVTFGPHRVPPRKSKPS